MSSTARRSNHQPVLISVGGLPATGKTTIARAVASELRAAYIRIDSIEAAIARAEGDFEQTNGWRAPPGYAVGYDVVADQLRNGLHVVAESVNALQSSRDAWRAAGLGAGATVVEVEVICSDVAEHRRRAEERVLDIAGLTKPTWEQISEREYDAWERDRVVIDTVRLDVHQSVDLLKDAVGRLNCPA